MIDSLHSLEPGPWACCVEFVLLQLIGTSAIAYTSPSNTRLRAAASLGVILICTHMQWGFKPIHDPSSSFQSLATQVRVGSMFHELQMVELLLLARASYVDEIQRRKKRHSDDDNDNDNDGGGGGSLLRPMLWSLRLFWNPRRIGTRWQVKNIPQDDQRYSRSAFVRKRLTTLGSIGAGLYALKKYAVEPAGVCAWVNQDNTFLVGRLDGWTLNGFLTRTIAVISAYCFVYFSGEALGSALAVPFVGLGLDEPTDWPPVMGPISSAWSVRRFWGVTWHQTLRKPLTAYSDFITFSILRLPRGSLLARYTRLFLVFGLSGLQHSAADLLSGYGGREALIAFPLQAAGIMIEDAVQALYDWISPPPPPPPAPSTSPPAPAPALAPPPAPPSAAGAPRGRAAQDKTTRDERPRSLATAVIGYTWTMAFLGWSSALWLFPNARGTVCQ